MELPQSASLSLLGAGVVELDSRKKFTTIHEHNAKRTMDTMPTAESGQTDDTGSGMLPHVCTVHADLARPWLNEQQTLIIARLRTAQGLYSRRIRCPLCPSRAWVERDGRHAKNCVGSGLKNRLHGMAVKTLERLASLGMTVPRTEQTPFGSHNLRIDLVLYELIINHLVCVLDYACINPTNTRNRTAAAMESPGGAATQYEQVKHNH